MIGLILIETIITPQKSVYAYLDPGSGSFILQIILASLLGALIVLRSFWTKIINTLRGLFSSKQGKDNDETD